MSLPYNKPLDGSIYRVTTGSQVGPVEDGDNIYDIGDLPSGTTTMNTMSDGRLLYSFEAPYGVITRMQSLNICAGAGTIIENYLTATQAAMVPCGTALLKIDGSTAAEERFVSRPIWSSSQTALGTAPSFTCNRKKHHHVPSFLGDGILIGSGSVLSVTYTPEQPNSISADAANSTPCHTFRFTPILKDNNTGRMIDTVTTIYYPVDSSGGATAFTYTAPNSVYLKGWRWWVEGCWPFAVFAPELYINRMKVFEWGNMWIDTGENARPPMMSIPLFGCPLLPGDVLEFRGRVIDNWGQSISCSLAYNTQSYQFPLGRGVNAR